MQGHPRGRDPSEQDVNLIVLLLGQLSDGDPVLANQHILDAVLPLNERQVSSLMESVQRGVIAPSGVVDALISKPYSPFYDRPDPSAPSPTTPAPGSSTIIEPRPALPTTQSHPLNNSGLAPSGQGGASTLQSRPPLPSSAEEVAAEAAASEDAAEFAAQDVRIQQALVTLRQSSMGLSSMG